MFTPLLFTSALLFIGIAFHLIYSSHPPACASPGSKGTLRHHGTFERYTRALGILIIMIPGVRYTTDPFARSRHHSTFSYCLFSGFLSSPRPHCVLSVFIFILSGRGSANTEALHVRRFCIWPPPTDCGGTGAVLSGNRRRRLTRSREVYLKR